MTMKELGNRQKRFVDEYLVDLNATQAAIRAGYSKKTSSSIGEENLRKPEIAAAIEQRMKDREKRTEITQDMVLNRWWQIATADPRNLIEYRRCACRHCYGKDHEYHWIDEGEFEREYMSAVKLSEAAPDENHPMPDNVGGYGFNPTVTPNPECPKCFGRGHGEVAPHDTRNLDEQSALLYAGVKVTKEGLEFKLQDQGKALENVARHLGMFTDKTEITGKNGGPIQVESETIAKAVADRFDKFNVR
jgi:phage terminase small subunit